jgi:solute carrier family 25 S-adenosylmethionine transporter 26
MAGTAVDTALFPLDTLKTRLQSKAGFAASGGFRGVYSGLTSAVIGSAPGGNVSCLNSRILTLTRQISGTQSQGGAFFLFEQQQQKFNQRSIFDSPYFFFFSFET